MDTLNYIVANLGYSLVSILILITSLVIIILVQILHNRNSDKQMTNISNEISKLLKKIEIQGAHSNQFNNHFEVMQSKVKNLEEIVELTSRDISSMADGITGEVGIGKAIEMARKGASISDIKNIVNLTDEQTELIVKFHGKNTV